MNQTSNISHELFTVRDYLRWGISEFGRAGLFFGHGTDNAYDEARVLVAHALNLPFDFTAELLDARLTVAEREQILSLLAQRVNERLPAAYLTKEAWFAGLSFYVDERVLVPRSPMAELIEQGFQPWLSGASPTRILDLCTGSGCIGIACAYLFEEASVDLADISIDALNVADINIARHELSHRVRAVQSDVFDLLDGERYDLIVSNPPYVDAEDIADMPAEYHREPALGLASGLDGLDITRKILRHAASHLNVGGVLVVEVGNSCVALDEAFPQIPFMWLEFERGGHGVFVITREQLLEYQDSFV
ncbi:50S ribosomal protein L3 glutamine methyltransferase [Zhongshania aliphaticivorans]|uniref:Ribosomal protein uL3 glutamine methyltransferase n=1 Tax=Zhongshania aliphaticivorans TaxID=1470434 RepID=A0A5S9NHG4_9GAMM|nr:50S ribosomal protein L3 N(5)-glutamine methyltransferase [Zhongshania aliphaticivorans]CAA0089626.1 50S ribosomal protein L3 glutamine methyltransferase [Zhongshania aliphaticivorans]CAA0096515.1 50S ribosomal protein L3 glutamine methyltransferase [Zhongshania aliphaticivorans]